MLRQLQNSLGVVTPGKGTSFPVFSSHCTNGMNFFDGRHFKINKILLSIIGQWPYQTTRRKYVSLVVLFVLAGTQIIAKLCATLSSYYDINVVMTDMAPLIGDIMVVIKLINSTVKTKKMKMILNHVRMDYASLATDEERKIMHDYANDGRKFTIMYSGILGMTMLCFMIPPLKTIFFNSTNGTDQREFVHHTEYFVDPLDYYYPIILHSYITIFIVISIIVVMDIFFIILVQHACGLFTALGYRLCHIIDNNAMIIDINLSKKNDQSFKNIVQCVRKHQEAIEFAKLMESYYSTSFFVQAGINMIGMSITGLQALTTNETNNFFQHFSVFFSSLAHIFFECLNGQRIINHSAQIYQYLINIKWYKSSSRTRKVILFMLIRSQVSCKLTAGNILNISMETFSSIIRTSISYFTMLRSLQ